MNHSEMCRICTSYLNALSATNLFERKVRTLLAQIKDVTGQLLKDERDLPKYICPSCEENLKRAYSFRKRCLDSQSYFSSSKYKRHLRKKFEAHKLIHTEEENDEEEIVVIIKEEASVLDANENDILEIYTERKNDKLDASAKNDSLYPPDPTMVTSQIDIDPQAEVINKSDNITNSGKIIRKSKKNMCNKIMKQKGKKSDEKIELICDQCGNHFNCRHHFLTHLRRHINDKPFKCEVCPDKFYTHSELKRHMRRHTGEKPFACKYCQRHFSDYSTRIKHERTHTNERPYLCPQCGKAFTTSYVLKNHMLVHTGERSFKCSLCNKAFQRQTHLTVHFRSTMHKQMLEKQEHNQEGSPLVPGCVPVDYINNKNFH